MEADLKKCALIRQTWYEAARKRMKEGARLAFYEACFDFEFYGKEPGEEELFSFDDALLMFDMVRHDLQNDMEKAERIAMRNRRNGMLGGRPPKSSSEAPEDLSKSTKPKETQKKPKKTPKTQVDNLGSPYTYTLHNTTQQSVSSPLSPSVRRKRQHRDTERYTRFRVMFVFFYSGAADVEAETEKFYNYYAARDWMVGKNQPVKDKVALAKTWEIKDANAGLIESRKVYASVIEALDPDEPELLTDFLAWLKDDERKEVVIRTKNGNRLSSILEHKYLAPFSVFYRDKLGLDGYDLIYHIYD